MDDAGPQFDDQKASDDQQAFSDQKAPGALRTIGEVAKSLGIRQHVLRYWEEQFPMLRPLKRSGGRRYYRTEDVTLVETIDRLVHKEGYTLKGAKGVLLGKSESTPLAAPLAAAPQAAVAADDALISGLASIRMRLAAALDA